jgi:tetratricopeptide (TPR) repeat protein
LAEARLQKDPDNQTYKMQLANAYVYVSKKQLDGGHKMQAGSSLKKAKNLMQEVLAKDPNSPEAFFAVGLFNYYSDNVPAGFKWLASLLGFKGDRKLGKEYIQKASLSPNLMKNDALYMLYHISARSEHNYEAALPFMAQLHSAFPQNYIFTCKKAEMEFRTKRISEAKSDALACFSICDAMGNDCHKGAAFILYYFMTDTSVNENDLTAGKQYYLKALSTDIGEHKKTAAKKMAEWKALFGL